MKMFLAACAGIGALLVVFCLALTVMDIARHGAPTFSGGARLSLAQASFLIAALVIILIGPLPGLALDK